MNTPPLVLCIAGSRCAGKDTLLARLRSLNPDFRQYAFAQSLKNDLSPFVEKHFGWGVWNCTSEQKEILRPILIAYGCAQRAVNVDHWAEQVAQQILRDWRASPSFIPCITDLRFPSECVCLQRHFGSALRVVSLTRVGAPEPTEEEQKHGHKVAAMAHLHLTWGNDTEAEQLAHAHKLAERLGLLERIVQIQS